MTCKAQVAWMRSHGTEPACTVCRHARAAHSHERGRCRVPGCRCRRFRLDMDMVIVPPLEAPRA